MNCYQYEDGGAKVQLKTNYTYLNIDHSYVKALSGKWSYGYESQYINSSYDNYRNVISVSNGIEYNIYPYEKSSSKYLVIRSPISTELREYAEETIYDKKKEWLFSSDIGIHGYYTQKWGNINGSFSWYTYLHDVSRNNFSLNLYLDIRIVKDCLFFF